MTPDYIKGWRDRIGKDPNIILQASGPAQKAANFILEKAGIKLKEDPDEETQKVA
ncbi:MAG: hypothetical protein JNJ47_03205 [Alphaproteobacteria bacterium]|nr:hypothetical protein [Alphaproteobacteria bacterium]